MKQTQRTDGTQASEASEASAFARSVRTLDCSILVFIAPALSFELTRPRLGRLRRYFRHSPTDRNPPRDEKTCKHRTSHDRLRDRQQPCQAPTDGPIMEGEWQRKGGVRALPVGLFCSFGQELITDASSLSLVQLALAAQCTRRQARRRTLPRKRPAVCLTGARLRRVTPARNASHRGCGSVSRSPRLS